MEKLASAVIRLRNGPIGRLVRGRMEQFKGLGSSSDAIFNELCFCILTANYTAEGGIRIQKEIGDDFTTLSCAALASKLRSLGHRFPNTRARYITEARKHRKMLAATLASAGNDAERREWLAVNVLGLGYKEASHFLRNIGYSDVAIIDFHIIDLLARHGMIKKPKSKSLSRKKYLEIERTMMSIAKGTGLSQGALDLYLWYLETGKILK